MHSQIRVRILLFFAALVLLGSANARAYQLLSTAGGDAESTSTFSIDSVMASHVGIAEDGSYDASAAAPSGTMHAAAAVGIDAFTGYQKRSVARIEERITFKSNPTGPVTVTISLSYGGSANATSGTLSVNVEGTGPDVVSYQFQNGNSFTVPEAGAGAAATAAVAVLAGLGRARRTALIAARIASPRPTRVQRKPRVQRSPARVPAHRPPPP